MFIPQGKLDKDSTCWLKGDDLGFNPLPRNPDF